MTKKRPEPGPAPQAASLVDDEYKIVVHPSGTGEGAKPQFSGPSMDSRVPAVLADGASAAPSAEVSPPMTLDVWLRVSGHRPEQIAGFRFVARRRRLGPATASEWAQRYAEFMNRPVR